jgi:hypothetical protein
MLSEGAGSASDELKQCVPISSHKTESMLHLTLTKDEPKGRVIALLNAVSPHRAIAQHDEKEKQKRQQVR